MAKTKGGLTKWFKEDWVDIKTGKKCGRKKAKGSKRPYPACRPKAVAAKMTKAEKAAKRKKKGPKAIKYAVTASGRRRKEGVTKEDEDYYASFFEMFRSDGWKQLILELQTNANSINSVKHKDADDLHFRKGQINVLAYIINLEGSMLV